MDENEIDPKTKLSPRIAACLIFKALWKTREQEHSVDSILYEAFISGDALAKTYQLGKKDREIRLAGATLRRWHRWVNGTRWRELAIEKPMGGVLIEAEIPSFSGQRHVVAGEVVIETIEGHEIYKCQNRPFVCWRPKKPKRGRPDKKKGK